jgi:hypothetical protein
MRGYDYFREVMSRDLVVPAGGGQPTDQAWRERELSVRWAAYTTAMRDWFDQQALVQPAPKRQRAVSAFNLWKQDEAVKRSIKRKGGDFRTAAGKLWKKTDQAPCTGTCWHGARPESGGSGSRSGSASGTRAEPRRVSVPAIDDTATPLPRGPLPTVLGVQSATVRFSSPSHRPCARHLIIASCPAARRSGTGARPSPAPTPPSPSDLGSSAYPPPETTSATSSCQRSGPFGGGGSRQPPPWGTGSRSGLSPGRRHNL